MRFLFLVWALLTPLATWAALRFEPLPEVAARPASGPQLDRGGLVELAFILSGTPTGSLPAYRAVIDRWSAEFLAQAAPSWDEARKAEALLLFLHSKLKSYSLYQTRLDVLVDRGTFNCVSSALAYLILGRDAGLNVQAVATDDHAFAQVRLSTGKDVDVETTTRYGFDPGSKTEFTDSFGQTGFVYVPPGNYDRRHSVDERQLLGLLLQNRMVDYQRGGQPEEAVGLAVDRWTLEGTPEAFKTLIDGFTNYGAWLNSRREYAKGLDLVDNMATWTGPVPEAKQLAWAFLNNHVNTLLDRQDFAGAQVLTSAWKNRGFLTDPQATQTLAVIFDRQLASEIKALPYAQAAERVEGAYTRAAITAARRQELLTYLYGQEVQRLAQAKGPQAAWTFLVGLPTEVQAWPPLVKAKEVYAYNWGVDVHNRFAKLWNEGKRVEARQLLADSLAQLPNNPLLKKDQILSQAP